MAGVIKTDEGVKGSPPFPRIGITTAEVIAEVNRLLSLAAESKGEMGAVNWGDLGVADVEYRLSMLHHENGPRCVVIVEEASPGCALATWLNERIDQGKFPHVWVVCEW